MVSLWETSIQGPPYNDVTTNWTNWIIDHTPYDQWLLYTNMYAIHISYILYIQIICLAYYILYFQETSLTIYLYTIIISYYLQVQLIIYLLFMMYVNILQGWGLISLRILFELLLSSATDLIVYTHVYPWDKIIIKILCCIIFYLSQSTYIPVSFNYIFDQVIGTITLPVLWNILTMS